MKVETLREKYFKSFKRINIFNLLIALGMKLKCFWWWFQFWTSKKFEEPLICHYSQVHYDLVPSKSQTGLFKMFKGQCANPRLPPRNSYTKNERTINGIPLLLSLKYTYMDWYAVIINQSVIMYFIQYALNTTLLRNNMLIFVKI